MKKKAILRFVACLFMTALSGAGSAAEEKPFAPISPRLFPWSPLDALPPLQTDRETLAWRVESPPLAGNWRAAAEWGNVPIAGGPSAREDTCPDEECRIFSIDPSVYGGYAGSGIFGGIQAAIGYSFFEPGAPGPFFAAGAAVERIVSHDTSAGWNGRAAMVGGLAGALPFPWSVSLRALAGDAAANPRAELIAEAVTVPAQLGGIGQFRLAAASGCAVGALSDYPVSIVFRSSFELEGREYRGALAKGLAARAGMEALWLPEDGSVAAAAGASVAAALRFGDKVGMSGRAGLRYDGLGKDNWKSLLRSPKASALLSGDLGLSASCELPVLFARGRLFMSEAGSVEFFLKPYAEILLLRASGRELFVSDNLHGDGGLELAMTVDADRRDALRLGAGFDFSPWMQGSAGFPGFGNFGVYFLFSIAI